MVEVFCTTRIFVWNTYQSQKKCISMFKTIFQAQDDKWNERGFNWGNGGGGEVRGSTEFYVEYFDSIS